MATSASKCPLRRACTQNIRVALHRVVPLPLWDSLVVAVKAALTVFGVVHLLVLLASVCIRPTFGLVGVG